MTRTNKFEQIVRGMNWVSRSICRQRGVSWRSRLLPHSPVSAGAGRPADCEDTDRGARKDERGS